MDKVIYQDVFEALNKNNIRYVVAGGVAVVLHGYIRFTADLDLIVLFDEDNIDKFYETLSQLKYKPRVPVTKEQLKDAKERQKWREEKNMKVFSFFHEKDPLKIIDMFIQEDLDFGRIYEERKDINIYDITIPLISIKHLKELKRVAGRQKDLIDLEQLNHIDETSE